MPDQKRTMLEWFVYLDSKEREFTLMEFMAQMLMHCRQHLGQISERTEGLKQATEHVEGMVGTFDDTMAQTHPVYQALAIQRGKPNLTPLRGGQDD